MYGSPAMPKDLNLPFGDVSEGRDTQPMFAKFGPPDPRDYLGEKQSSSAAPQAHLFFQQLEPQPQQLFPHLTTGGEGGSVNLLRHGSLNVDNGLARGMGSVGLSFAPRLVPEITPEGGCSDDGGGRRLLSGYPVANWDDSVVLSDGFGKRIRDPSEIPNGEMRSHHLSGLTHHLSLPNSSPEVAAMERFLQFQDAVPCKIRAKRGCATHPRSIAERVRRTRISERIKKLQELVPNMDKQTNTADMLDLAVDYIKDLQMQAKALADSRANCTCPSRHRP